MTSKKNPTATSCVDYFTEESRFSFPGSSSSLSLQEPEDRAANHLRKRTTPLPPEKRHNVLSCPPKSILKKPTAPTIPQWTTSTASAEATGVTAKQTPLGMKNYVPEELRGTRSVLLDQEVHSADRSCSCSAMTRRNGPQDVGDGGDAFLNNACTARRRTSETGQLLTSADVARAHTTNYNGRCAAAGVSSTSDRTPAFVKVDVQEKVDEAPAFQPPRSSSSRPEEVAERGPLSFIPRVDFSSILTRLPESVIMKSAKSGGSRSSLPGCLKEEEAGGSAATREAKSFEQTRSACAGAIEEQDTTTRTILTGAGLSSLRLHDPPSEDKSTTPSPVEDEEQKRLDELYAVAYAEMFGNTNFWQEQKPAERTGKEAEREHNDEIIRTSGGGPTTIGKIFSSTRTIVEDNSKNKTAREDDHHLCIANIDLSLKLNLEAFKWFVMLLCHRTKRWFYL
ncbi:unnamed protein product [Amoebophrya sp. A120]|nr:unnamed protein product [Amoebophrya sp. A120]|eukprot:GSA120T00025111001.1